MNRANTEASGNYLILQLADGFLELGNALKPGSIGLLESNKLWPQSSLFCVSTSTPRKLVCDTHMPYWET